MHLLLWLRSLLSKNIINTWNKDSCDDTIWWLLILKRYTSYLLPKDLGLYEYLITNYHLGGLYNKKCIFTL